jgi:hypothetical protein
MLGRLIKADGSVGRDASLSLNSTAAFHTGPTPWKGTPGFP